MSKLSKKQKEVIQKMRAGGKLLKLNTSCSLFNGDCSTATFFVLLRSKLIKQVGKVSPRQGFGVEYRLTTTGKTIEL